nr:sensor of ECF-type sigma factor [uncultured Flavobacterium sp.]
MKIRTILPLLLFLISFSVLAQDGKIDEKREKIKAFKVSFLTTELELTSTEAEKFWPIYNAYDDKQFELKFLKMKTYLKKLKDDNLKNLSDKEASTLLSQIESTDKELYQLREKFMNNVKKVLSPKKILLLKKSEDDFNRKLLQQYRDKGNKD